MNKNQKGEGTVAEMLQSFFISLGKFFPHVSALRGGSASGFLILRNFLKSFTLGRVKCDENHNKEADNEEG